VFCTPVLQRPLELGADLVVHSATKHLDGQGRVLGGAVLGSAKLVNENLVPFLRTAGPSLSPFNAWVILKGLETLDLRVRAQSASALALAQWLEKQPAVARVHYPGLASHPQHALAARQQKAGGAVLSFELKGGRAAAWRLIDATRLVSITANLGDVKTTITHPATTTHGRLSPEARAAAGIGDGLVRLAVGLESVEDLKADLAAGLG
jgi:O-succinylhomoserine sulfhydrylase